MRPPPADAEAVSLLAVLNPVLRRRYLVAGVTLLACVGEAGRLLVLPRNHTSESSFMLPPHRQIPGRGRFAL